MGDVRVVVPYVPGMLRDATYDAVMRLPWPAELFRLSLVDEYAYGRAFRSWWADGVTFVVVEHDMVPTVDQIQGLFDCDGQRCCHGYLIHDTVCTTGLGLTKFNADLMAEIPSMADRAMEVGWRPQRPAKWFQVDAGIARVLDIFRRPQHVHVGLVEHLHEYRLP